MQLPPAAVQALQVLAVLCLAPLLSGAIAHVEARLQGRRGPRILQPYYDLAKLFQKETLAPVGASWWFLAAPVVAFTAFLTVPLLIPVLTDFPLPLGYMGDILGGGLILALGGFSVALAAAETGDPYAQLGSSRAMTFGALIEPSVLFVVFTVALITTTDLPYAMAAVDRSSLAQAIRPAHLLAAVAFFLVVLSDTGRIPVETHASTLEFGMIDEARSFEHSGPALALLEVGLGHQTACVVRDTGRRLFGSVGSRRVSRRRPVLLAVPILFAKALGVGTIFAVIDNTLSKLRLYKITEFMASAFALSAVAVLVLYLGGG